MSHYHPQYPPQPQAQAQALQSHGGARQGSARPPNINTGYYPPQPGYGGQQHPHPSQPHQHQHHQPQQQPQPGYSGSGNGAYPPIKGSGATGAVGMGGGGAYPTNPPLKSPTEVPLKSPIGGFPGRPSGSPHSQGHASQGYRQPAPANSHGQTSNSHWRPPQPGYGASPQGYPQNGQYGQQGYPTSQGSRNQIPHASSSQQLEFPPPRRPQIQKSHSSHGLGTHASSSQPQGYPQAQQGYQYQQAPKSQAPTSQPYPGQQPRQGHQSPQRQGQPQGHSQGHPQSHPQYDQQPAPQQDYQNGQYQQTQYEKGYSQPPQGQYSQYPQGQSQPAPAQYNQQPHAAPPPQTQQQRPNSGSRQPTSASNGYRGEPNMIPGSMGPGPGPYGRSQTSNPSGGRYSASQPELSDRRMNPPVAANPHYSPDTSHSSLVSPQRSASPAGGYARPGPQPRHRSAGGPSGHPNGPGVGSSGVHDGPGGRSYSTPAVHSPYNQGYNDYPSESYQNEAYPVEATNIQRNQVEYSQPPVDERSLKSPTSPTFYQAPGNKAANISTNKIPPASTIGISPISPLAAEYRKELPESPIQLYDDGDMYSSIHTPPPPSDNDPSSPFAARAIADTDTSSPAETADVLNMYLEDENSYLPGNSQDPARSQARGYQGSDQSVPPMVPPHQTPVTRQPKQPQGQSQRNMNGVNSNVRPPPVTVASQHSTQRAVTDAGAHQHQYSSSSHHSSGSSTGQAESSKPPPVRQYGTQPAVDPLNEVPPNAKPKVLTVEEFERIRKLAKLHNNDPALQLEFAKKLVEASQKLTREYSDSNTVAKPNTRVDSKTERRNRENWMNQAYKIVKKLSGNPYADAVFYLASNYSSGGLGLETDHEKAYELYMKAAKLEQAEAAYRVAVCNEIGAGTKRDPVKAVMWYKKAAQMGDVSAMYKLGMISLNGLLGQSKSLMEAVTWLQRAADKADAENPHAVHELGLLYERADSYINDSMNDLGTSTMLLKDDHKAFELFVKAAKLGYPPSQFRLGCCYEYGTLGCPIDPKRSIAWYSRAAEKGEPESELALSGWYLTGSEGILQQSDTEAYLWARKAAEKGLAKAEYALGYFSEVGIGVKVDRDEAKKWYYKAAAQKHPKALSKIQELR
ncbi:Ack1p [Sugiyamaella lignohabitans]|uniref:Ack1p n=1 Tax=Sugiyamaella lignohabitans TaxID=796027 RepID=A0A161HIT8_9ASCO|nr:Ack1p [Sugiyamaella lignohabitans]ANB12497.1 Ack1p [Sugiyamaella lignohabitans]